jgi:hypothetical protein
MDTVAKNIANSMDQDTIFLLISDHGMTEDGDHGGVSEKESSGVLFAHSKKKTTLFQSFQLAQTNVPTSDSKLSDDQLRFVTLKVSEFFNE